jgi:hypothetical protein
MNTSDIRDMDRNQTVYWLVAVPVTLLTLLAAFAYGYKGDDIRDWLYDKFRRNNNSASSWAGRAQPPQRTGTNFPRRPTGSLPLADPSREALKQSSAQVESNAGLWNTTKEPVRSRVRRRRANKAKSRDLAAEAADSDDSW